MTDPLSLGRAIKGLRDDRGLSQQALAAAAGLDKGTVNEVELGKRDPRGGTLKKLADGLGVTVEDIFRRMSAGREVVRGSLGDLAQAATRIPLITEAQAGQGRMVYDGPVTLGSEADRWVPRPAGLTDPRAFAVLVQGDSMLPIYRPGHYVVVSPATRVAPGDEVFVALMNGERVVKIAHPADGGYVLESANPAYPPRVVYSEDVEVMFAVVFSQRKDIEQ